MFVNNYKDTWGKAFSKGNLYKFEFLKSIKLK